MNYEITGVLLKKYDAVNVSKDPSKEFWKRECVLSVTETNNSGTFTDTIIFEFTKDNISKLDAVNENDSVTIQFGISGRGWTKPGTTETRYFNNLRAWKIEKVEESAQALNNTQAPNLEDNSDDLPFN